MTPPQIDTLSLDVYELLQEIASVTAERDKYRAILVRCMDMDLPRQLKAEIQAILEGQSHERE